jgi:hypothetical protein
MSGRFRVLLAAGATLLAVSALLTVPAGMAAGATLPNTANGPAADITQASGPLPAGFQSWDEVFALQERLNSAALAVLAAGGAGIASFVAAPTNRELRVYWPGAVPAAVREAAAKQDVPVRFLAARYAFRDLVAEAQRLAADPRVTQAAAQPNGNGVAVTVTTTVVPATGTDLLATARMPLSVTVAPRTQALFSRQNDVAPFSAGSRYDSPAGSCSNGLSVFTFAGGGARWMLSAGHCGSVGQGVTVPGQASPTGTVSAQSTSRDGMLISYPGGEQPLLFSGAFDAITRRFVGGAAPDFVGNVLCTSGAFSGAHCSVSVNAVDVFATISGIPGTVGPLTSGASNGCAAAPGDSGGPVFRPYINPDNRAMAATPTGTITAGAIGTATCPGLSPVGSNSVLWAPLVRPSGDPQIGNLQFFGVLVLESSLS